MKSRLSQKMGKRRRKKGERKREGETSQKARAPCQPSGSSSTVGDTTQTCGPSREQTEAPADVDSQGGGSPETERSLWVVTLRFHRLVLQDGAQSSHLTREETDAHREGGFRPHCRPRGWTQKLEAIREGNTEAEGNKGLRERPPMSLVGAEQRRRGGSGPRLHRRCAKGRPGRSRGSNSAGSGT